MAVRCSSSVVSSQPARARRSRTFSIMRRVLLGRRRPPPSTARRDRPCPRPKRVASSSIQRSPRRKDSSCLQRTQSSPATWSADWRLGGEISCPPVLFGEADRLSRSLLFEWDGDLRRADRVSTVFEWVDRSRRWTLRSDEGRWVHSAGDPRGRRRLPAPRPALSSGGSRPLRGRARRSCLLAEQHDLGAAAPDWFRHGLPSFSKSVSGAIERCGNCPASTCAFAATCPTSARLSRSLGLRPPAGSGRAPWGRSSNLIVCSAILFEHMLERA